MATLPSYMASEFSPRRKLRYFQFAMFRAARVLYRATTINATNFGYIQALYKRPWRKSTATTGLNTTILKPGNGSAHPYVVGELLTLVKLGGSGGLVKVSRIDDNGRVLEVTPVACGSGYTSGTATSTSDKSGTGCTFRLTPTYGRTIDVMDQVKTDMQNGYGYASSSAYKHVIKDWYSVLGWMESALTTVLPYTGNAAFSAFSGSADYAVGAIVTYGGAVYYCKLAHAASATTPNSDTTNWAAVTTPVSLLLASIAARTNATNLALV